MGVKRQIFPLLSDILSMPGLVMGGLLLGCYMEDHVRVETRSAEQVPGLQIADGRFAIAGSADFETVS
jgi:hypothetical protein